jgi:uncharacterized protein with NAD-binding domain and iron-sulfur cluster
VGNIDPARYANEQQALHQQYPGYYGPRPPKKTRIRNLVNAVFGRRDKKAR